MGNTLSPGASMMERQKASMKENMDRQMRLMQAQQMAMGRQVFKMK